MEIIITLLYLLCLTYLFAFSIGQLHLTWNYLQLRKRKLNDEPVLEEFPNITIQLPVYNEKYVVERLLDAISKFDYPKEKENA